jgi:heptosyltransferase-2
MVKKILINFPTNLGDAVMSLPVLDRLRFNYPQAEISAITSPLTDEFLSRNSFINETIVYKKSWKPAEKIKFALTLRDKYDLTADLKNSFLPVALGVRRRTPFLRWPSRPLHLTQIYLGLIGRIAPQQGGPKSNFALSRDEEKKWQAQNLKKSLFIACSSRSEFKQYPYSYLKETVEALRMNYSLVILGEARDRQYYKDILNQEEVIDLVGKTTIVEAFYLLKNYARLLLCVDSGLMHIGSYLNLPLVVIFGSTSSVRYGSWSRQSVILESNSLEGSPRVPDVKPQETIAAVKRVLANG